MRHFFKFFLCISVVLMACDNSDRLNEEKLIAARNKYKLDVKIASQGFDENVLRSEGEGGLEYGIIFFPNKDTVQYWFLSHHLTEGNGGTLFELPDGRTTFVSGCFCCEVQLPYEGKFPDAKSFIKVMESIDGSEP